ncbi:MAG: DUF58 domain-containing protein [Phycisphaeraceae bacterium]|nr:DUF58 domain-containing protein [Phycisphaeraceae bacterium]
MPDTSHAGVPAASDVPKSVGELLGPGLLRRLDSLDILSRKMFAGKLPGERRSKRRGQSVEFDDYRPYVAGDDLRHIDWNVYARLERFFLKIFREEEDLSLHLAIDLSESMDFGEPRKRVFAARLALALGYIGLVNQNRVSAMYFGRAGSSPFVRLAPMRGRREVERLGRFLLDGLARPVEAVRPEPVDFTDVARRLAHARSSKGVLVVVSDFMFREGYVGGLNYLAATVAGASFDTYAVQVLSREEADPTGTTLVGDLRLTDSETAESAEVTVSGALIKRYRERLEGYVAGLERACQARGIQHLLLTSDADLEELLLDRLRGRGLLG